MPLSVASLYAYLYCFVSINGAKIRNIIEIHGIH